MAGTVLEQVSEGILRLKDAITSLDFIVLLPHVAESLCDFEHFLHNLSILFPELIAPLLGSVLLFIDGLVIAALTFAFLFDSVEVYDVVVDVGIYLLQIGRNVIKSFGVCL